MVSPYNNQNYTREDIEAVLIKIKQCVESGHYQISMNVNRQENIDFINEYNIYPQKRREILMKITADDFCHTLNNTNVGYEHEVLYVFVPQVDLYNALGESEKVEIYTKFNVIEMPDGARTVVVSFHKKNKPIDYLFR